MKHAGTITRKYGTDGGLDGFTFECAECAERASFSFLTMTQDHARRHAEYMQRKARLCDGKRHQWVNIGNYGRRHCTRCGRER